VANVYGYPSFSIFGQYFFPFSLIFQIMKKLLFVVLIFMFQEVVAQKARRIEVLFLGDNGHHKPMDRFAQISAALGHKGVNFTYTNEQTALNDENLAKYDALLVYANHDQINPEAENALLKFVAAGKAILPIHCASYCFRNSTEYVKMVGGQFWRHTMDTVSTKNQQAAHPILKDLKPIRSWDETYLHTMLQADNNILQTRPIGPDQAKDKPGQKEEPYTWTRSYGLGRVFYTAYGHDENTWGNPNFQNLIYNGLLWALPTYVQEAHKALNFKPFEYRMAQLPNYEKREGPQVQQLPLSPEEAMKHIQIPANFNLSLFAAEPNVQHPIAMAWDQRGRLYVLITKDYPNERKDSGGTDFILICEDTDADGKADKFTKFAEGLSIPTGLVFSNGGLVVCQAPHILFLKDTNGDDRADERKILFTGFGTSDTHAGPSNLHYGLDNWIWGSVGYSGFNGKVGADSLRFGQALFRFKTGIDNPEGPKMEWMTSTSNNTWGMAFNEAGDVFGSTANNAHGWYMAIPHSNYLNPGYNTDNGSRSTDTHKDMKTITPKIRQVDVFGGFTAAAGHNFYTARAFPKNYWNKIAFVAEPTGHVLHQNNMVKKGTNYEDEEAFNLMAGADEWFSPVFAQVGPDGAVWVADWYSFIIQHNPRPDGFVMGTGNAYETNLRDYTHGRIYKVAYNKSAEYKPISLSADNALALIEALKSDNMFWRNHAQRLLVERGKTDVTKQLINLINTTTVDELGLNTAAIHALWVLKGLGEIDKNEEVLKTVYTALKHPSWAVRKNAIQVLPTAGLPKRLIETGLLTDTEPLVALNAVLKMNQCALTDSEENTILDQMQKSSYSTDRWFPEAFATNMTAKEGTLLKKYLLLLTENSSTTETQIDHNQMNHSQHKTKPLPSSTTPPNNTKVANTKPTLAKKGVDLIISSVKFEVQEPSLRETSKYVIEVENKGLDSLKNGQTIMLKIDISGQGQSSTIYSHVYNKGLGAGATATISKNTNGPWTGDLAFNSDKAGEYTFAISIDYQNKIAENDEKNNTYRQKITVNQPATVALLALEKASKSYASVYDANKVVGLLAATEKLNDAEKTALLKGTSTGWNYRKKSSLSTENLIFVNALADKLAGTQLSMLNRLRTAWTGKEYAKPISADAVIIQLKTVVEAMKFDKKEFTVKAGKEVVLNIENPDAMQHNVVIGKINALNIIGKAADKMITQTNATDLNYVPAIPQVLVASPLINANSSFQLRFVAPSQPGAYPFICTFPGHWRLMNGIMKVVK
jgi:uncharacterized protein